MRRFGLLHHSAQGLGIGDPTRRNALLLPDAIGLRYGADLLGEQSWGEVTRLTLTVPTTRFRFPGAASAVVVSALALLVQSDPGMETESGILSVQTANATRDHEIDTHHMLGYWRRGVVLTQRFLDRLVENPESRELLLHPAEALRAVARASGR